LEKEEKERRKKKKKEERRKRKKKEEKEKRKKKSATEPRSSARLGPSVRREDSKLPIDPLSRHKNKFNIEKVPLGPYQILS